MPIKSVSRAHAQDRLAWAGTPNRSGAGPAGAWAGHPPVAGADRAVPFHTSRSASVPVGYPSVAKTAFFWLEVPCLGRGLSWGGRADGASACQLSRGPDA